jgi:hypothetical protein
MITLAGWITQEEAQSILAPHHDQLRACVSGGWAKWIREIKPRFPTPTRRLRANAIWDGMVDEARVRFNDIPGVVMLDRGDRFFLAFDGRILARFKKLDGRLRTRNYPTQGSLQFDAQMNLPAVPDGSMLTIGYRVDEETMSLKDILVVMSRSKRVIWSYDIDEPHSNLATPLFPQPGPDTQRGSDFNRFRQSESKEDDKDQ